MRNIITITLLALIATVTHAAPVDSLYNILKQSHNIDYRTANKLIIMLDAAGCADSLYQFNKKSTNEDMLKIADLYMAYYYGENYQHLKAAKSAQTAAAIAEEQNDLPTLSDAYSHAGVSFERLGNHERAIELIRKGLKADSIMNDKERLSSSFSNLAAISIATKHSNDAILYIQKAIKYEENLPKPAKLAIRYGLAAEAYNQAGNTAEAMKYAEMAYEIERKADNKVGIARRLSQMADIYSSTNEYRQAENMYLRSIEILTPINELHSLTINYNQLGKLYFKKGNYNRAIDYLLKAEKSARTVNNNYILAQTLEFLAKSYRAIHNNDKSYIYLEQAKALQDSITTDKMLNMSAEYSAMFDNQEQSDVIAGYRKKIQTINIIVLALIVLVILLIVYLFMQRAKGSARTIVAVNNTIDRAKEKEAEQYKPSGFVQTQHQIVKNGHININECTPEERKFVLKIVDYVNGNMLNGKLSVEQLASELCISRSQLTRRINALNGGEGTTAFINSIRLEKAMRLLKHSDKAISEIATECGFEDASYFVRVFKGLTSMTPSQYRNMPGE